MNISVKLPKVRNDDIYGLRKFSDDVELSNVRSLSSLGIETSTHDTSIATLILEKLLYEIKLIVARNVKETWGLTKILEIVNQELEAREAFPLNAVEDGKNGSNSYEEFPYTGSSFHVNRYRCQKLANI